MGLLFFVLLLVFYFLNSLLYFLNLFLEFVYLFFNFLCHFFRMFQLVGSIFLSPYLPQLYQCRHCKNAADDPVQYMLVVFDLVRYQSAAENEQKVADKSADADACDINVIMIVPRL